jgi:hypothetical protein
MIFNMFRKPHKIVGVSRFVRKIPQNPVGFGLYKLSAVFFGCRSPSHDFGFQISVGIAGEIEF